MQQIETSDVIILWAIGEDLFDEKHQSPLNYLKLIIKLFSSFGSWKIHLQVERRQFLWIALPSVVYILWGRLTLKINCSAFVAKNTWKVDFRSSFIFDRKRLRFTFILFLLFIFNIFWMASPNLTPTSLFTLYWFQQIQFYFDVKHQMCCFYLSKTRKTTTRNWTY